MAQPLILDLETKYTFREFSEPHKLGISVVGVYDYADGRLKTFFESELSKLYPLLEHASVIIGYNSNSFDLAVLKGYYPGDIGQFKTLDLLEEIKSAIGRRVSLNDVVYATLNKKKSGHGLQAIKYYNEGRFEELCRYCLDDVALTRELFEYGVKNQEIFYPNGAGKSAIKVNWKPYLENTQKKDVSLTLPF